MLNLLKGGSAYPSALSFPTTASEFKELTIASAEMLEAKAANLPIEWSVWSRAEIRNDTSSETTEVMELALVIFFMVIDGFLDHDLDGCARSP